MEYFELYKAFEETDKAVSVDFRSNVVTTYHDNNPSFRVFEIDAEYKIPLTSYNYFINLTKANANPDETPEVELQFEMVDDFGMLDLSPASFYELARKIRDDEATAAHYKTN